MKKADLPIHNHNSPKTSKHHDKPRNYGPLFKFNGYARITGPCGDTMTFWVQVSSQRITNVGFTTDGCSSSRAAGSMATQLAIGKSPKGAASINQADVLTALGGLPEDSEHCALLAADTLKAAIHDFGSRKVDQSPDCQRCDSVACSSKERRQGESEEQFRQRQTLAHKMCQIGQKLLVLSGKGGVGKSTIAANLAVALAEAGKRVGLLDIDMHGPSIPKLLGVETEQVEGTEGGILPVKISDNLSVISVGFLLPDSRQPVVWRGPRKHAVIHQFLADVAWGPLDYLVVDAPPGTGDEPMSIAQLVGPSAVAVIITTPQEVALSDVRRCVTFCNEASIPVLGILENMSGLVCPKCGDKLDIFKRGGGLELAKEMDVPFLGQIPIDPKIVVSGDDGIPLLHDGCKPPTAKAFSEVIDLILRCAEHDD